MAPRTFGILTDEAVTNDLVNDERDRRIAAGFMFEGNLYQGRPDDRENIAGAKSAATDAVTIFNAQPGDLAWQQLIDPKLPDVFTWITADDTRVPMDAHTMMRLGYAAMAHKQKHIFIANEMKKVTPIPPDYIDDKYWT